MMRSVLLARELTKKGHEVTLWTSSFNHFSKSHRFSRDKLIPSGEGYDINFVYSPGYKNNVSLARFFDHLVLSIRMFRRFKQSPTPDVAFVGFPPIEVSFFSSFFLQARRIPFLIDVKDAWPEIFFDYFPKIIGKLLIPLFTPLIKMRNYSFRKASGVVSISDPFINWSLDKIGRNKSDFDEIFPLLPNFEDYKLDFFNSEMFWDKHNYSKRKKLGKVRCFFVGSFTNVFDFSIFERLAKLSILELVIAGVGPKENNIKDKLGQYDNVLITGEISRDQLISLAKRSDFLIAPYKNRNDFVMSLPNKFWDAFALQVPIITSLDGYAKSIIDEYKIGFHFSLKEPEKLIDYLQIQSLNSDIPESFKKRYDNFFNEFVLHQNNYADLVRKIENLKNSV